ncbi:MAG: SLBB domain-containing protein [Armatimonadetes bacterium]|nr:SLBB domain-containing protein [Armatimonadota bacterium]
MTGPQELPVAISSAGLIPERYQLGPGDVIILRYWSPTMEVREAQIKVDPQGEIVLPMGTRLSVRGQTLSQFERMVRAHMLRMFRNVQISVALQALRQMLVQINGEAFAPGSYQVPATATLFNVLYAAGGPSDRGTLRDIQLKRGQKVIHLDFYRYLLKGESSQDIELQPGDAIFIPLVGPTVSIAGEVKRAALYELKGGERLQDVLAMAGGLLPTALNRRVVVDTVKPNQQHMLIDVDLSSSAPDRANPPIYDGDYIQALELKPYRMNMVNIEGPVSRPGSYGLIEGMTVADLVRAAEGLMGDAYPDRADIYRLENDETLKLLPFNLDKAMAGDPEHNLKIIRWDRVIVYSQREVVRRNVSQFVNIHGSVLKPGIYERPDGMRLRDLLMVAGGPLPASYSKIEIARAGQDSSTQVINADLEAVWNKQDESQNIVLQNQDQVYVRERGEFIETPMMIELRGAVKVPGFYPLKSREDRLSDLIERAGGLRGDAFPEGIEFQRNPNLLVSDTQRKTASLIAQILRIVNEDEYKRRAAQAEIEKIQVLSATSGTSNAGITIPGTTTNNTPQPQQAAGTIIQGISASELVSRARPLVDTDLLPAGRVVVNMNKALKEKGSSDDVVLAEGDKITIPTKPITVAVEGAVVQPSSLLHVPGQKVDYYVNNAGGYAPDAAPERILVIRANGHIQPIKQVRQVGTGDIIFVPTKVMAQKIKDKWSTFDQALRPITNAALAFRIMQLILR